jgi:hypothetical protein
MMETQPTGCSKESIKIISDDSSSIHSDSFKDAEQTEEESPETGGLLGTLCTSQTKKSQVRQCSTQ